MAGVVARPHLVLTLQDLHDIKRVGAASPFPLQCTWETACSPPALEQVVRPAAEV